MSQATETTVPDDGIRHYTFLCLLALGVMALAFFLRGVGMLCLLPAAVGALTLATRWRSGALGVLLFVVWLVIAQRWWYFNPLFVMQQLVLGIENLLSPPGFHSVAQPMALPGHVGFGIADVLLCAASVLYVAGYYRLLSLTNQVFPGDPRRLGIGRGRRMRQAPETRSNKLVTGREVGRLAATIPIWLVLAWLCWRWLETKETQLNIDDNSWQLMLLIWLLGMLFLLASSLVRYLAQGNLRPEEAALYLQDTLWRDTSREQRRIHRWLVWARRRRQRKEGV
jgi:hypothetical protein